MTDEQISTYIDGQLNDPDYTAFKAQLAQDVQLQQQVALTRLLVREARQLSLPSLPQHFALPATYAHSPKMPWWDGRLFLRAASLFSAAICAVLLSIDAGQWSGRIPTVPQAVARTMTPTQQAQASTSNTSITVMSENATVPITTRGTQPSALRMAKASPVLSAVPQSTDTPTTSLPTLATPAPNGMVDASSNAPILLLPRILGLVSGFAALLFAGLGWRQR